MRVSRPTLLAIVLAIVFISVAVQVSAQPVWTDKRSARGITLDWLKPFFKDGAISASTSILYLSGRIPVSNTLRLKPELPLGYYASDHNVPTESTIGNPYIGLEVLGNDGSSTAEIGIRLPAIYSQTPLTQVAVAADFDRFEAFAEETAALVGNFVGRNRSDQIQMEVAGGMTVLVPFNDESTDILARLAGQLVFETGVVDIITGITGRILFTGGGLSFGERSTFQAGLGLVGKFGMFRPGVMARLPLDDPLRMLTNFVAGVNASFEF